MKKLILISMVIVAIALIMMVGKSQLQADRDGQIVVEGYLEPFVSVEIRSKVSGEIEKIFVDEGDFVEKGGELLKINAEEIIEEYEQAKASYEGAQKNFEMIIKSNALEIDELHAEIERHRIFLKASQADLAVTKAESLMEIARSEADWERERSRLTAQKARSLQEISEEEAEIARIKSRLERDKISLSQTQVRVEQEKLSTEPAKVELQNAEAELNRKSKLYEQKLLSERDLEESQRRHTAAKSRDESIEKDIQQAQSEVQTQQESVREGERDIQIAENELTLQKQIQAAEDREAEIRLQATESDLVLRKAYYAAREKRDSIGRFEGLKVSKAWVAWLRKKEATQKLIDELEVAVAQARLREAKSLLDKAQKRLEYTTIRAPIAGTIVRRVVEAGEIINAYTDITMELADLSDMIVRAYVNEANIDGVKVGQSVAVKVTPYPKQTFAGKIRTVFPGGHFKDEILAVAVDKESVWCGTTRGISRYDKNGAWPSLKRIIFEVEIDVEGLPKELRSGMTAEVEISY
ncbi:HlyD family efflux transporter periplasmic adaptor subunit [Candidatus Poribacteria bacterium]|nr:HlyD family efflux transporter periplasmic adaptor subunit [Candidatus Poribacteria bacterium]